MEILYGKLVMPRVAVVICSLAVVVLLQGIAVRGDALPDSKVRMLDDIKYLASDDLEGRGPGTNGINLAADFIKSEFAKSGLAIDKVDGGAAQTLEVVTGSKLVEPYSLQLIAPDGTTTDLKIGSDVEACSFGGSGTFSGDVVFCGYAIDTTNDPNPHETVSITYNDFEGIDVQGKIVIIMRRNPRQSDSKNPLGAEHGISRFAELRTKMNQLAAQKAAAVLIVNDPYSLRKSTESRREGIASANSKVVTAAEEFLAVDAGDAEKASAGRTKLADAVRHVQSLRQANDTANDDILMKFGYAGSGNSNLPPAFHLPIKTCNQMLAAIHTDLGKLEAEIDSDLKPKSKVVTGWKATGSLTVEKSRVNTSNIIGTIEGEGPLADETVVVGAHYDHVGRGGANSLAPGSTEIHNGADDNASGTTTLIELARRFGAHAKVKKPARRLVFIAFTGEELGLLGSARYCKEPVYPLDKTIAMLNMDMVGRLKEDKLIVYGTKTSSRWEPELTKDNTDVGFKLIFKPEGFGPSDHSSFYAKKIPVLHFFTGEHADYHKPSDDWEKINVEGMVRVANLMEKVIQDTLNQPERPDYVEVKGAGGPIRGGNRPYVGTIPEFGNELPGYAISGVSPGSPGDKGGLKGGDRIVKMGTHEIKSLDDYDAALRKFAPGDDVDFVVVRDKDEVTVKVKLEPPR